MSKDTKNTDNKEVKAEKSLPDANIPNSETSKKQEAKYLKWLKETSKKYIRVGDNYYKIVLRPDREGKLYKDFVKTIKSTITDDYSKAILKHIDKYDDFVTVASHTHFRQVINGFYNQYSQLSHQPEKGNYDTIMSIITHVFGEQYTDFALDYLQLLYTNPYQRLPIILLESKEKNTGKSTFANLIYMIFQDNAIKIGNNDLQSDFNSFWVTRLAIIVDETQLEKQGITQMLKRYSTETGKVVSNEKNQKQREVDFFGKFIFISNEEGKALRIEKGDPRWAVFKVPTFSQNGIKDNPLIEPCIAKEIPCFLHFLLNRKLRYPQKGRQYFEPSVYQTAQLQLYYNNSYSATAKAIKQLVIDTFELFPNEETISYSRREILEELKADIRNVSNEYVIKALESELNIKLNKRGRYTYFSRKEKELNEAYHATHNGNNTYYKFSRIEAEVWKTTTETNWN